MLCIGHFGERALGNFIPGEGVTQNRLFGRRRKSSLSVFPTPFLPTINIPKVYRPWSQGPKTVPPVGLQPRLHCLPGLPQGRVTMQVAANLNHLLRVEACDLNGTVLRFLRVTRHPERLQNGRTAVFLRISQATVPRRRPTFCGNFGDPDAPLRGFGRIVRNSEPPPPLFPANNSTIEAL